MLKVPSYLGSETLHLELDPQPVEYLIPNSGLVGFHLLVHETPEPQWVHHQSAIFLGAQFHTMLHLVGTHKVHLTSFTPRLLFCCGLFIIFSLLTLKMTFKSIKSNRLGMHNID